METILGILAIAYLIGAMAGVLTLRSRAGIPWTEVHSLELLLKNPDWFFVTFAKSVAWPVVLPIWVSEGKPESPWRLNDRGRVGRVRPAKPDQ